MIFLRIVENCAGIRIPTPRLLIASGVFMDLEMCAHLSWLAPRSTEARKVIAFLLQDTPHRWPGQHAMVMR